MSDEELEDLNVTKTDLILTSENAYFTSDFDSNLEGEKDTFLLGAQFDKTVSEANEDEGTEEVKSTLIIYGDNYFVSDYVLSQNYTSTPMIAYGQNKDLVLNSIAYLTDREEDITVRKSTGSVTYTATEQENNIILAIITAVPIVIIIAGVVVWQVRRRKK